jgi:hypothetical protein
LDSWIELVERGPVLRFDGMEVGKIDSKRARWLPPDDL